MQETKSIHNILILHRHFLILHRHFSKTFTSVYLLVYSDLFK